MHETWKICSKMLETLGNLWRYYFVLRWHKHSSMEGRVWNKHHPGHLLISGTEENENCVKAVLARDQHLNMLLLVEKMELLKTDVHWIITEHLNIIKICVKLAPQIYTINKRTIMFWFLINFWIMWQVSSIFWSDY